MKLSRSLLITGVSAVAFAGCLNESGLNSSHASPAPAAAAVTAAPAATHAAASARASLPDFGALVEEVGPAVVNISTTSVVGGEDEDGNPIINDPMFDFFRRFGIPVPGLPGGGLPQQPRISQGIGSGFIVSADGYVLTNAHVVADAKEVTVKLTDKREFKAKVVGADRRTDVALLKIDAKGLPSVKIGDAERTRVGEWVVAVGSPFGFENTVTAGIVSAKARRLPDETYVPFLQTDVAINPGNSGGPLFNLSGEVVGINSQIYSRSGGFQGISFAIPIDVAMTVKEQLQKYGKVSRGKLGVVIQGMDKELAQSFGLDDARGALVASVEPGSPAEKAGVQPGDVILSVDGTKIDDSGDLPRIIGEHQPGDAVKLELWRNKATRSASVKLAEQGGEQARAQADEGSDSPSGKLGLTARPLNPQEAARVGVDGALVVERVGGAAARAGLRPGDLILAVSNQPVSSAEQLRRLVDAAGKRVPLLVQRNGQRQYLVVRLG